MRNQASATARVIAAATVFLHAQQPVLDLVSREAAQLCAKFLSTSFRDRLLRIAASTRSLAWLCWALERATLPGIVMHYARRKRTIEREVRTHLQSTAINSVYVLGAGFDTLCLRIAREFPNVRFIEFDHPATQAVKTRALAHTQALLKNLEFRPCDLLNIPITPLFTNSPSETVPGNRIVIAEGLFMYFTATQVEELLRAAIKPVGNSAFHNICIFTYMEQIDNLPTGFRPRSWLIERWLEFKREPFLWSANRVALAAIVLRAGGEIKALITTNDFDGDVLPHAIKGENIVVARSV
jgi:O-methyltransferase involved in polyketide biosynthesis